MRKLIDRAGLPAIVIVLVSLIISAGLLGYMAGSASSDEPSNTSVEYMDGWEQGSRKESQTVGNWSFGMLVSWCSWPAEDKTSTRVPSSYTDQQRRDWSRGCLDYLRNQKDVPQQSWE